MAEESLEQRRNRALGKGAELFFDAPLEIVRGEGAYLFDAAGRRYVDLYNNVPCVGHGNAAVARAMASQQATLNVHNRYLHEGIVRFAERLLALHHDGIESVVFSCTGTEANEVALRAARLATGQQGIVCTDAAYHGNAGLVDTLTGVGNAARPDCPVRGFPFPDCYRPLVADASEAQLVDAYLDRIAAAIADLRHTGHGFAGFIACPIFANEGLPRLPAGIMPRITELVHREGGLMIADEVQSGYGRTGHWWGYQSLDFRPDVVVMGKPMGNGLPLAATAAQRHVIETFRAATGYFNTFSSTPLQAACGMAVIDEIERMDLVPQAARTGQSLAQSLAELCADCSRVGEVRHQGLFLAVEMVRDRASREPDTRVARKLVNRLKDEGFLCGCAGAYDNVIKLRPPLVFTEEHAGPFLEAFARCIAGLHD